MIDLEMKFEKLDKIKIKKPTTWKNKIFLTIDLEWANDEVINFLVDLLIQHDVKATFFLTHYSKAVKRILHYKKNFSVGLHPNYNNLLDNREEKKSDYRKIFLNLFYKFKGIKMVRSHSLVNSSKLTSFYKKKGIKFVSNELCYKINKLKPWEDFNKIVNLPIIWADDIALYLNDLNNNLRFIKRDSLNILDFHPTSVFTNSCNFYKNQIALRRQNQLDYLNKNINKQKFGIRDFLLKVITHSY
jgi:hypothetical protein